MGSLRSAVIQGWRGLLNVHRSAVENCSDYTMTKRWPNAASNTSRRAADCPTTTAVETSTDSRRATLEDSQYGYDWLCRQLRTCIQQTSCIQPINRIIQSTNGRRTCPLNPRTERKLIEIINRLKAFIAAPSHYTSIFQRARNRPDRSL